MTPVDQLPPELEAEPVSDAEAYWATKQSRDVISQLALKESDYFQALKRRGLLRMWRVMWAAYYGQDPDAIGGFETQMISVAGEDGELLTLRLNEVRPLASRQVQMAVGERAAFQCYSVNNDYSTKGQINTCDSAVEYVYREAHVEQKEHGVVEGDIVFGQSYGWARWDRDGGDDITLTEQQPIDDMGTLGPVPVKAKSGVPTVTVSYPWEVIQEVSAKSHLWRMVRERASKWELIANYPEAAQKLRAIKSLDEYTLEVLFGFDDNSDSNSDDVIVKHFYHERCAAVPEGRYLGFVGDVMLWDLPCPVAKGLPLIEMCSARFIGTTAGYSDSWDLVAPTQLSDQITSDIASNLATFGRQVIAVWDGTKFDVDALANGHRVLAMAPGTEKPEAVSFAGIPEASRWALEYLNARRAAISGINEAAQGNPEAMVKSGTYAALLHAIAIEAQAPRQTAFDAYREGMANLLLDLIRQNAKGAFLIAVAGLDERPYLKEFTADSLSGVKRVVVKTANPMMRSQAGRLEIYQAISTLPPEDRAAAYELIVSGNAKEFAKKERSEDLCITWENEQLSLGEMVPVTYSDNHQKHWLKHKAEYDARRAEMMSNPEVLQAFLSHMLEHERVYAQETSPIVSEWLGMLPAPIWRGMGVGMAAPANDQGAAPAAPGGPAQAAAAGAPAPSDPAAQAGVQQPKPAQPAQPPGSQEAA